MTLETTRGASAARAHNPSRDGATPSPATNLRHCRICGCTDGDCRECIELTGGPCWWVQDDLCSACVRAPQPGADLITLPAPVARVGHEVEVLNYRLRPERWEIGVVRHVELDLNPMRARWSYRCLLHRRNPRGRVMWLHVGNDGIRLLDARRLLDPVGGGA